MDWSRLLNGVLNQLLRRFLGRTINTGIDYAARRGKDVADMTPDEREQARSAKQLAQRARKISRLTRRL
jgi:hypothetical protein